MHHTDSRLLQQAHAHIMLAPLVVAELVTLGPVLRRQPRPLALDLRVLPEGGAAGLAGAVQEAHKGLCLRDPRVTLGHDMQHAPAEGPRCRARVPAEPPPIFGGVVSERARARKPRRAQRRTL